MSESDSITKICTKCGRALPATLEFFREGKRYRGGLRSACRQCLKSAYHEYYTSDLNRHRERKREWARTHPDQHRQWAEHNVEARRAIRRRWYLANRGLTIERAHEWAAANPEKRREYCRNWEKNNPEKCSARWHKRRALQRGNGGDHSADDVLAQYTRQKGKCFYCGKRVGKKYHVDHVIPLSKGGSNGPENIVVACPQCNQAKGAKHPMDFCGKLF